MANSNTIVLSYKYRLYPTATQSAQLDFLLWQTRKIYNGALAMRIEAYQERGETIGLYDLRDHWCAQRNASEDLALVPRATVDATIRRLEKAYKAFFRRAKSGETPGFPRFKGRRFWNSLDYVHGNGCKFSPGEKNGTLRIMNVGNIRVRCHRALPAEAKIKMAVVKRTPTGKWYVTFQIEALDTPPTVTTDEWVGIDVGLMRLLTLSDGTMIDNPRWLRANLARLRVLNRKLARQQKGSARREKTRVEVARLNEKVTEQRKYFWHKVTDWLTRRYSVVVIEGLTLDFMQKNRRLSLSAADASIGLFWQLLDEKANRRGVVVVRVNPAYTSQLCSGCGEMVEKPLSQRTHSCPNCGLEIDRDVNAAINILNRGIASFGSGANHAALGAA